MNKKYDIAISFAGEDRAVAKAIADNLFNKGIKVFYDDYEKADLWGKDLYEHLIDIYKNSSKYCLMLLSENYKRKLWTSHERKAAQNRAFNESAEYILPLRLDDTEIQSVLGTTGYIDFRNETIDSICSAIEKKLWKNIENDYGIAPLKSKLEDIYNKMMVTCDLIIMPSTHQEFGRSGLVFQLYPTLVKSFSDAKSQSILTAANFDKLILSELNTHFDNTEKIIRLISFLLHRLDPKYENHDFIMETPSDELSQIHDFLRKLNLFTSYASRNLRYYTPAEIISNWEKAEVENNNLCFSPSKYVITEHRKAFIYSTTLLSKIHCKEGDHLQVFTDQK